jgi:hypothetical protein
MLKGTFCSLWLCLGCATFVLTCERALRKLHMQVFERVATIEFSGAEPAAPRPPPYATALTPRRHPLGSGAGWEETGAEKRGCPPHLSRFASPRRSSGLW